MEPRSIDGTGRVPQGLTPRQFTRLNLRLHRRDIESLEEPLDRLVGPDENNSLVASKFPLRINRAGEAGLVFDGDDATACLLVAA